MILVIIFLGLPAFFFLGLAILALYFNIFHDAGFSGNMVISSLSIGILLAMLCYVNIMNSGSSSTTKNEKIICQVCDREFQKGSENAKSIRKTNMCTDCYRSYKGASDALKELPIE